jgi:hypothetical protein
MHLINGKLFGLEQNGVGSEFNMKAEEEQFFLWSVDELVTNFPVKLLRNAAKSLDIKFEGKEHEIAQRLLDIGWRPPKRGLPIP